MPPAPELPPDDPFDTLLTLEDTLYTSAYTSGAHDGARAGRIEGRIFGLEKGFEKYSAMGVLHGRALVWGSRLAKPEAVEYKGEQQGGKECKLPVLGPSQRLQRNIHLLTHLTDPSTFSTENTEDAVADFDDRLKRAGAKAKVIEKTIGETSTIVGDGDGKGKDGVARRGVKVVGEGGGKKEDSIEDFAGSRFLG